MIAFIALILIYLFAFLGYKYIPIILSILSGDKAALHECENICDLPKNKINVDWRGQEVKERDYKE